MADRPVTRATQDSSGKTYLLGNPGHSWSPRSAGDVITDIESGAHTYHVSWPERRTEIEVVDGAHGKYLRTDRDSTTSNNLNELKDV